MSFIFVFGNLIVLLEKYKSGSMRIECPTINRSASIKHAKTACTKKLIKSKECVSVDDNE